MLGADTTEGILLGVDTTEETASIGLSQIRYAITKTTIKFTNNRTFTLPLLVIEN